jgi:glycosyltransferase involved in cell wall biosynthesis
VHQAGLRSAASYLRAALPVVRRLCRTARYDVVHCFFSLPTGLLLPVAGLRGTPVVMSLRGSDVPGYDSSDLTLQRLHRVLRPLTRRLWRRAGRVVALSDALAELARNTDRDIPLTVIRNGVDTELFHPPVAPRPVRMDRVRCLAVSRLVERKGLADLLHALASLERGRFELEIVGEGRDEAELRALTARLGLTGEVRFAGALDRVSTAERYRGADLFTLASWDESFGNVFAEAMASGLPIVGTNVGGIPEFITHEENGLLVPPRDPAAIAAAIRRMADDPPMRAAMRDRNRAKAESELSWQRTTRQYLAIYTSLAARRIVAAPVRTRALESARVTQ